MIIILCFGGIVEGDDVLTPTSSSSLHQDALFFAEASASFSNNAPGI